MHGTGEAAGESAELSADRRPEGVAPDVVAGVGRITEALETVERARGHLYAMHQLTGEADFKLDEAVSLLRRAGHGDLADRIETELIGRNVLTGRWTYQLLEEYDDGYYADFRALERLARESLMGGLRHVHESVLKERRRTKGRPGHEAAPEAAGEQRRGTVS
ncbi:hypothetical protein HDA32_004420 [Spinactinospora alkalitolerans]|uniref:Uncharacterized protein n=1 Tax=Spinactinospora alkalitolerans TaxID=687207 RepID=A0A852U5V8_9ACTN|nr:hypothetical protein [Spinactinospora alkalitolerans]NYE49300.1 hypothetical protein [Spinactinospora alkalitolerans]